MEGHEKPIYRGEIAWKGGLRQFGDWRGLGKKDWGGGGVFLRGGVDAQMHTVSGELSNQ